VGGFELRDNRIGHGSSAPQKNMDMMKNKKNQIFYHTFKNVFKSK